MPLGQSSPLGLIAQMDKVVGFLAVEVVAERALRHSQLIDGLLDARGGESSSVYNWSSVRTSSLLVSSKPRSAPEGGRVGVIPRCWRQHEVNFRPTAYQNQPPSGIARSSQVGYPALSGS